MIFLYPLHRNFAVVPISLDFSPASEFVGPHTTTQPTYIYKENNNFIQYIYNIVICVHVCVNTYGLCYNQIEMFECWKHLFFFLLAMKHGTQEEKRRLQTLPNLCLGQLDQQKQLPHWWHHNKQEKITFHLFEQFDVVR